MKKMILILLAALLLCAGCEKKQEAPKPAATEAPAPTPADTGITVFCRLDDGTPVAGATVQICSGSLCQMLTSDGSGLIVYYPLPGKSYDVSPIRAPQGYTLLSDRAVPVTGAGQRIEFVFEKQS